MNKSNTTGNTSITFIFVLLVALSILVILYKEPVSEEFNKFVTTESSVSEKIAMYALSIINNETSINKKISLLEVQYSETGKVAIIVVKQSSPVDKDDVLEMFDTLNDLEYVDDVKVVYN